MRFRILLAVLAAAVAVSMMLSVESDAQSLPELLTGPERVIPETLAALPQPEARNRFYPRWRLAEVTVDSLILSVAGDLTRIDLFDDARFVARTVGVESDHPDEYTWRGEIVGVPFGHAKFEIVDDVVHGRIAVPGAVYVVRYAGNDLHTVRQVDPTAFQLQGDDLGVPSPPSAAREDSAPRAPERIQYLGLWSRAAKKELGGKKALKAMVKKTVSDWNDGAKAAGIDDRLVLAGIQKLKLKDVGATSTDLRAINDATIGATDAQAAALRNQFEADFVGWYTKSGPDGACGVAWRPFGLSAGNDSFMYSVVQTNCNDGFAGGAHEVLHNMSGCHPKEEGGCSTVSTPYSFGFLQKKAKKVPTPRAMTILGTFVPALCPNGGASCTMLTTMSFKKGKFMGNKMGSKTANIGRMVNENAALFAGFR